MSEHSFQPPDQTIEISRLQAEVERLQHINKELLKEKDGVDKDLFGIVCFERDEALAQVAVLCNIGDQIINRWWTLTDEDANPLADLRSALMVAGSDNVKHKARALLDRLQRAEAVVESLKLYMRGKCLWGEVSKNLAAWEEI